MNQELFNWLLGPNGDYGNGSIAFVNGQLVIQQNLSPKGLLDAMAKLVQEKTGSPIPEEVAAFLEASLGLK